MVVITRTLLGKPNTTSAHGRDQILQRQGADDVVGGDSIGVQGSLIQIRVYSTNLAAVGCGNRIGLVQYPTGWPPKRFDMVPVLRSLVILTLLTSLAGCGETVLAPIGPIGAAERVILLDAVAIMLAIVVPTIVATLVPRRSAAKSPAGCAVSSRARARLPAPATRPDAARQSFV